MPAWAWNGLLVVFSLAAGLAVCEAALRLADTRYEHAAAPPVRAYHWSNTYPHPDAGTEHEVLYNRFGNRQHRDFSESDLRDGINVAFFGDSFTEGLEVPAQYTFVEVLDHLLNAQEGGAAPAPRTPVHVHNFGVNGTGPGSQYLRYRGFPHKDRLRHVFYIHCENDFRDLRRVGLYSLNAAGELVRRMRRTSAWIRFLSGFRLTYLALDVWQRVTGGGADHVADTREAVLDGEVVFEALLSRWRDEAEANGSAFHVVLLPDPRTAAQFHRRVRSGSFDVLDLGDCFDQKIPGFVWENWRFRSDGHWNEAGHMVAAHCLYRFLESRWGRGRIPDTALAQARHAYYRAFADDAGWPGHRFMPSAPWALPPPGPLDPDEAARIRAKHLALKTEGEGQRRRIAREMRQEEPVPFAERDCGRACQRHAAAAAAYRREYEALAERPPRARPLGNWSAHVLAHSVGFLKDPCESGDLRGTFFLHMYPADPILARDISRDIYPRFATVRIDGKCLLWEALPPWAVATVSAGQREGEAVLWEATFHLDVERHRRAWAAVRSKAPPARGSFNVHRRGAELVYVREPCDEGDVAARFFLHVRAGTERSTLDFDFKQRGVLTDGRCVALAPLPEQDIDRIRTGQFAGDGELWSVEL